MWLDYHALPCEKSSHFKKSSNIFNFNAVSVKKIKSYCKDNLSWPVLNIRSTCTLKNQRHIWKLYFVWLQSQHCVKCSANQTGPIHHYINSRPPHLVRQPSPFGGELLYVYITITYFKKQRKAVWLRNNHMCKKRLKKQLTQLLYGCLACLRLLNQFHYLAA